MKFRLLAFGILFISSVALADRQIEFTDAKVVLKETPCEIGWLLAEINLIPDLAKIKDKFKAAEVLMRNGNKLKACYLEDEGAIGIRDENGGGVLVDADVASPIPLPQGHQSTLAF